MKPVVIIERRLSDWYMYVPALDGGGIPLRSPADAPIRAAGLLWAESGAVVDPQHVEVLRPASGDMLLPAPPEDVEILHDDGAWYPGAHVGWLRHRDHSWRALVCYSVAGVQWERALPASRLTVVEERREGEAVVQLPPHRRDSVAAWRVTERGRPAACD